jgi:hypothetical protein
VPLINLFRHRAMGFKCRKMKDQRPQPSSASRFTAGAFGFFTFTQCVNRPER